MSTIGPDAVRDLARGPARRRGPGRRAGRGQHRSRRGWHVAHFRRGYRPPPSTGSRRSSPPSGVRRCGRSGRGTAMKVVLDPALVAAACCRWPRSSRSPTDRGHPRRRHLEALRGGPLRCSARRTRPRRPDQPTSPMRLAAKDTHPERRGPGLQIAVEAGRHLAAADPEADLTTPVREGHCMLVIDDPAHGRGAGWRRAAHVARVDVGTRTLLLLTGRVALDDDSPLVGARDIVAQTTPSVRADRRRSSRRRAATFADVHEPGRQFPDRHGAAAAVRPGPPGGLHSEPPPPRHRRGVELFRDSALVEGAGGRRPSPLTSTWMPTSSRGPRLPGAGHHMSDITRHMAVSRSRPRCCSQAAADDQSATNATSAKPHHQPLSAPAQDALTATSRAGTTSKQLLDQVDQAAPPATPSPTSNQETSRDRRREAHHDGPDPDPHHHADPGHRLRRAVRTAIVEERARSSGHRTPSPTAWTAARRAGEGRGRPAPQRSRSSPGTGTPSRQAHRRPARPA